MPRLPLPARYEVSRSEDITQERYRIRPRFLYATKESSNGTLGATSQYGRTSLSSNMMKNTIKSPCPAAGVHRRHEAVATDAVYASIAVDSGVPFTQFYIGRDPCQDCLPHED
jgi:hypothetical protein